MKRQIKKVADDKFIELYKLFNDKPFNEQLLGKKLTENQSYNLMEINITISLNKEKYYIHQSMTEPILNHKIEHYV